MKKLLAALGASLLLAACVDTTGISPQSSRPPRGAPNGVVTVTEFADLQCPACRAAHTALHQPLVEKYGSRVRFEFKHFPLRATHRYALPLAEAAECAADQGKFWEFVDLAYENQDQLNRDAPEAWGKQLGLDEDLFRRCSRSKIKRTTVMADYTEGESAGVRGTPTFFVNGRQTEATLSALTAAIDQAISQTMQRL